VTSYLTIGRDAQAEIEVKRSRFLCTLRRVDDEAAARALVERLRRQHWDARHHCTAFVLGPPPTPVERSSDDGEPAGTAGAPMLEVLRGRELSDVAAVVTRWFGGTLLGTGGLARAYAEAVRAALDVAGTLRRTLVREHLLLLDHGEAARIESELRARGVSVLGASYAAQVELRLGVTPEGETGLAGLLAELTGGAAVTAVIGERWADSLDA
jgi:uncharacterized YigZ family protein